MRASYKSWRIISAAIIAVLSIHAARAGEKEGNGGGGVTDQGVSMTFYKAGLYVEPNPQNIEDVPGMDYLLRRWDGLDFLRPNERDQFKGVLIPSAQHLYYKVNEDAFDDETFESIKRAYQEATQIDPSKITLFAITDTNKRQTFLLPAFYSLKSAEEQAAILFHESYWLANPRATYGEVIAVEMAFEAMLRDPSSVARTLDFLNRFKASGSSFFRYALKRDFANGSLKGLVNGQRQTSLYRLLGPKFLKCIENSAGGCDVYLNLHLADLKARFPHSLFLKILRDRVGTHGSGALIMSHRPFTYEVTRYRSRWLRFKSTFVLDHSFEFKFRESAQSHCGWPEAGKECYEFKKYIWRDSTFDYADEFQGTPIDSLYRWVALFRGEVEPSVTATKKVPSCSLSQNMPACMIVTLEVRADSSNTFESEHLPLTDMGQSQSLARQFYLKLW